MVGKYGEPWRATNGVIVTSTGTRIPELYEDGMEDDQAERIVACINACREMDDDLVQAICPSRFTAFVKALGTLNPTALQPLLDLLHRAVTSGRQAEREIGLYDETNFLSSLEVALERLYDTGVTSNEEPKP